MTRGHVVAEVRRMQREAGTLRLLCARVGVHVSTLSNMLGGRNIWTVRVLRRLGLGDVRIVEQADAAVALPVRSARAYQPMWRLGDWPSRYQPTWE